MKNITFLKLGGGSGIDTETAKLESQEEAMRALGIIQGYVAGCPASDESKLPMLDLINMIGAYIVDLESKTRRQ
jgi:hypothetical protein